MKPLEIGKLYSCSGYFLLLYPDKEAVALVVAAATMALDLRAARATPAAATAVAARDAVAAHWSKRLKKPVSYSEPKTPLLVLSVDKKYVEVLAGDKKGWIINEDYLKIKELANEAA